MGECHRKRSVPYMKKKTKIQNSHIILPTSDQLDILKAEISNMLLICLTWQGLCHDVGHNICREYIAGVDKALGKGVVYKVIFDINVLGSFGELWIFTELNSPIV